MLVAGLMLAIGDRPLDAAPPAINYLVPAGGQRGTSVAVTCHGEFDWPIQVYAPGVVVSAAEEKGSLRIEIPDDLSTDRIWLRFYNQEGAGPAVPLLIGNSPEATEVEPNNSPAEAQLVAPAGGPVVINGVLAKQREVDGFAIDLVEGETLVAALDGHARLGSPMDAVMQLTSIDGTVLAENHDAVGLDPRLVFVAPKSARYIARVFAFPAEPDTTIELRGADSYVYRLTLTTGPFVTHALPFTLSGAVDSQGGLEASPLMLLGWNLTPVLQQDTARHAVIWRHDRFGAHTEQEIAELGRTPLGGSLGMVCGAWEGAARVRWLEQATPTVIRDVPSNAVFPLSVPLVVASRIREPKAVDLYSLRLEQGQAVALVAESPSLDLPLTPQLRLTDPTGKVVASSAEQGAIQDAVLHYKAGDEGEYQLAVSDRFQAAGERFYYRLSVREEESDFLLESSSDALVVGPGKNAELTISIKRHAGAAGAVGPIRIEAMGLPEGVSVEPMISATEGDSANKLILTFVATGPPFSGPVQLRGTAETPHPLERFVRTPAKLGCCFDSIWLTVVEPAEKLTQESN